MHTPLLRPLLAFLLLLACAQAPQASAQSRPAPMEIRVVDDGTGRGLPLVELETVHNVRHITDNAGRIAYDEPGHIGEEIFFDIHCHGYEPPKDGFGIRGVRIRIEAGGHKEIRLPRQNIAERLYRLTGRDLYRDSAILGHETPLKSPGGPAQVAGQDSVLAVPYQGKIRWFWGDTNRLAYPLGRFRTTGATTPLPGPELQPEVAINYDYFVGTDGFARDMVEVSNPEGVVWIDGVTTVPDSEGRERLVARFSRRKGLADALQQGMVVYNDDRDLFEVRTEIPLNEEWRFLRDHPITVQDGSETYLASGNPFPVTRVRKAFDEVLKPAAFQSWSCMDPTADPKSAPPRRKPDGTLDWRWQDGPPVTVAIEQRWLKEKSIQPDEAYFLPEHAGQPGTLVFPHTGTVQWNAYRKKWILIVVELAKDKKSPSMLGEVYYSEADEPHGPFRKAVKILSHDKQTFYNPCHHVFFDQDGGKTIYFEGTYCNTFTTAPATQRYNYNQMLYRLDLADERLRGGPGTRD